MIKAFFYFIKRKLRLYINLFTIKKDYLFNDQYVIKKIKEKDLSNKEFVQKYHTLFNNYFQKLNIPFENQYLYINQEQLFSNYICIKRNIDIFKRIYDGENIYIRSGNVNLMNLFIKASSLRNKNVILPFFIYNNLQNTLSFFIKFFFNIISLIRIIIYKIFIEKDITIIRTSNNFYSHNKYDYRISKLVNEIDNQRKSLCFFIRTKHRSLKLISHYLQRGRLSIFSDNIVQFSYLLSDIKFKLKNNFLKPQNKAIYFDDFDAFISEILFSNHLKRIDSIRINILIFAKIYKLMNVKTVILDMTSRSIMELLSAKSEGIKTIFFQNGTDFEFFSLHYFINNPKAPYLNQISLDEYYVFNKYWQSSYISKGKVFNYKNTIVSGYLRDQRKSDNNPFLLDLNRKSKTLKLPILFIIENEIPYKEILPYAEKLLKEGFLLEFKLRPQQKDAGDNIFNTMYSELISKGYSPKQITFNDLVFENINTNKYLCGIASYSTALLDCLIKGLDVFILGTNTWGDCFNLREYPSVKEIYCENSSILVERIQRIKEYGAEQKALYELLVPIYNPKFIENFVKDL